MSNTFGCNLKVTVFGESHGPYIGVVIDGLSAGIKIDNEYIAKCLSLRRPSSNYETKRIEDDEYQIIGGVFNGYSDGSPLTIIIPNKNINSTPYEKNLNIPRPGHADYTSHVKYSGFEDYRGGGHFSGRITASLVAGGAILLSALENIGIKIGSHILKIGNVYDNRFSDFNKEIDLVNNKIFPVIKDVQKDMEEVILNVANQGDSIGGILETVVIGLPVGLGNPMFDSIESNISKALFGIGGIKGIEFGEGFNFANLVGSEANDQFDIKDDKVITMTNHNGGINGGISNGMPLTFNVVVKPTPSISKEQQSINLETKEIEKLIFEGRHDPAIIRRINIVIRCMTAFVIADFLMNRYGEDVLRKGF